MPKKILVFPCGSEIGLEIHRSMRFSTHFTLIGASSVDDHGRFVYDEYISGVPFHNDYDFVQRITEIVHSHRVDAIYPTMDAVAETLQNAADKIQCRIIGSPLQTTAICASKKKTYKLLRNHIPTPHCHELLSTVTTFPIFIKPDRGYGSRNTFFAATSEAAQVFLEKFPEMEMLLLEHLPGKEWTVDCFSDRLGNLRFHAARGRNRISNGISVNTTPSDNFSAEFARWADLLNSVLKPRGAWFFQAKEAADGHPKLLEVAARLGGSSGLFRCTGVNFALLSAFDAFDVDVEIEQNQYQIELDRALENRYQIDVDYSVIYVDLDDCVLVNGQLNTQLIAFLYMAIAHDKKIVLLTRHSRDIKSTLSAFRISEIFDEIIQIDAATPKSTHIVEHPAIFIDDSFSERKEVSQNTSAIVFSPDMVEALFTNKSPKKT